MNVVENLQTEVQNIKKLEDKIATLEKNTKHTEKPTTKDLKSLAEQVAQLETSSTDVRLTNLLANSKLIDTKQEQWAKQFNKLEHHLKKESNRIEIFILLHFSRRFHSNYLNFHTIYPVFKQSISNMICWNLRV